MFTTKKRLLLCVCVIACLGALMVGTVSSATSINTSSTTSNEAAIPLPETTSTPQATLEPANVLELNLKPVVTLLSTPEPTATPVVTPETTEAPIMRIQLFKGIKAEEIKFLYSKGYIRVRTRATKKSNSKFLLKPRQKVKIIKESGKKWVKIRISKKKTGYVLKKFLAIEKKNAKKAFNKKAENFRLTGYCPCGHCSEGWGTRTRSGRVATAGRTIAADLSVLPMYTHVYIEGLGEYTVEDVGGGVRGRHIDVFCNAHSQCSKVTRRVARVFEIEG